MAYGDLESGIDEVDGSSVGGFGSLGEWTGAKSRRRKLQMLLEDEEDEIGEVSVRKFAGRRPEGENDGD